MSLAARPQVGSSASAPVERREIPSELIDLRSRVEALPESIRRDLQPFLEEVCEEAKFRGRVLNVAREALESLRLELEATRFDLEVTRRERDALRFDH